MCEYCNLKEYIAPYSGRNTMIGKIICNGIFEYCRIIYRNDNYYIYLNGNKATLSDPISYCPFCGRKLE